MSIRFSFNSYRGQFLPSFGKSSHLPWCLLPAGDAVGFTGGGEEHFSPGLAGGDGGIGANGFDVIHQKREILFDGGPVREECGLGQPCLSEHSVLWPVFS